MAAWRWWASWVLLTAGLVGAVRPVQAQAQAPTPVAAAKPAAAKAPRIQWLQPEHDFGTLYQNQKVTHDFVFRNTGKAPLKLGQVNSSCGCTVAKPARTLISPGGRGSIRITFDTGNMRDKVVKHVYVKSNDPATPESTLTVRAVVRVELEVAPAAIYFGNVKIGQTVERPVLIRPGDLKTFRVLGATSEHDLVTVSKPEPAPAPEPAGSYRVVVKIGPASEPTQVNTHIVIRTDAPHTRALTIPVYGRVVTTPGKPGAAPSAR